MKKLVIVAAVLAGLVLVAFGYRAYLVHELRKPVLAQFSDPESAQFRGEIYFGNWTVEGGNLCGQVNAKNKMGGYAGYQWFTSYHGGASVEVDLTKEIFDEEKLDRCDFDPERKSPGWWLRF